MKIQLKRSNQLEGGSAKEPSVAQMEYGELAVNYNTADPSLFIKDSADQIVKLKISEGAQVLISDTIPSTTENEPGTLWWNSSADSGQLFILYDDPANGGGVDPGGPKWIEASPTTGGPGGGGAEVLVQPTAPVVDDLEEGSLWWNSSSDDLQLYVLYSDSGNKKWVEASPMPGASDVPGYPDTGDGNGATLDSRYVQTNPAGGASQNVAGDLTLGTDKITLDATDGSAEFGGDVFIGVDTNLADERLRIKTDTAWTSVFDNEHNTSGDRALYTTLGPNARNGASYFLDCNISGVGPVAQIFGDGSAYFSASKIRLNEDGSGDFSNAVRFGGSIGNPNATITTDGSATFAGTIDVNHPTSGEFSQVSNRGRFVSYRNDSKASIELYDAPPQGTDTGKIRLYSNGNYYFGGTGNIRGLVIELEPDNPDNYTTTTDADGNETQVYNGPTLDVKERLQNLISRLDSLESDEIADDATSTLLLTTVNNINAQMTKVNNALTAIRTAANAAGTLDQLKTDIAAATADI